MASTLSTVEKGFSRGGLASTVGSRPSLTGLRSQVVCGAPPPPPPVLWKEEWWAARAKGGWRGGHGRQWVAMGGDGWWWLVIGGGCAEAGADSEGGGGRGVGGGMGADGCAVCRRLCWRKRRKGAAREARVTRHGRARAKARSAGRG
eukprot:1285268-Rhodomonas_salina.2